MSSPTTPTKEGASGGHSINVETSSREELIELVKKYYVMGKKMENRLNEAIEAYKKSKKEALDLNKKIQNAEEESQLHKTTSHSIIQSLQSEIQEQKEKLNTFQHVKDQMEENLSKQFQQEKLIYQEERLRLNDQIKQLESDLSSQRELYQNEIKQYQNDIDSQTSKYNDRIKQLESQQQQQQQQIQLKQQDTIVNNTISRVNDDNKTYEYINSLSLNNQMNLLLEEDDNNIESLVDINYKSSDTNYKELDNIDNGEDKKKIKEIEKESNEFYEKFNQEKENTLVFLNKQKSEIETLFNDFKSEFERTVESLEVDKDQQIKEINQTYKVEINKLQESLEKLQEETNILSQSLLQKDKDLELISLNSQKELDQKNDLINQLKEKLENNVIPPQTTTTEDQDKKEFEGKEKKLKALLYGAQKHVTEQKKQIQDKTLELQEKENEIIILKGLIENFKSKQNESEEISNDYNELKNSFDYNVQRLKLLENQLSSTTKDYRNLQNEFSEYKIKAYHMINDKNHQQDDDQEDSIEDGLNNYIQNNENEVKLKELSELNEQLNIKLQSLQESSKNLEQKYHDENDKSLSHLEELKDKIKILKSKNQSLIESFNSYKLEFNNNNINSTAIESQHVNNNNNDNDNILLLKEKYDKEIKQKEESINELTSQLNLFKRNNNSIMREKDKQIQDYKNTISKLTEELEIQSSPMPTITNHNTTSSNNNSNNEINTYKNLKSSSYNTSENDTDDLKKFNIEHLLPSSLIEKDNSFKNNNNNNNNLDIDNMTGEKPSLEVQDLLKHYAQIQANRDEELRKAKLHISQLQYLLEESEKMDERHQDQEKLLKDEIRKLERSSKRDSVVPEYAKNIILKFIETDDGDSLLPVLSTIMQFTPDESKRAVDALKARKSVMSPWRVKLF